MALSGAALISLDEARLFLQKENEEDAQDEVIEDLIEAASDEIARCTKREFAPRGEESEERTFPYAGNRLVDLEPYDVREVDAITLGADLESPIELAPAEWSLRPLPPRDGVFQSIRLRLADSTVLEIPGGDQTCAIAVTGKWGFPAVPESVKHWCKVTVATWLRKDVSAFSRTLQLEDDRVEAPEELPTAAMRGLRRYKRRRALVLR